MSIEIIKVITVEDYKSVFPTAAQDSDRIERAINYSFLIIDGVTSAAITKRWEYVGTDERLVLTEQQRDYIRKAFVVETNYVLQQNLDLAQQQKSFSFGGVSFSSNKPSSNQLCESARNYLKEAGLFYKTEFVGPKSANSGAFYDDLREYVTYTVADKRYLLTSDTNPLHWDKIPKYNSEGNVEFLPIQELIGTTFWGNIEGDIRAQADLWGIVESFTEQLERKQDIINKYADSASVSDNTLTINFSNGDSTSFTPTGGGTGGITDVQVTDTQGTASVVTAGVATVDLTGYATTENVNEALSRKQDLLTTISGYDPTKIQCLYNNCGTLLWSEEKPQPHWWDDVSSLTTADIGTTREVEVNGTVHTVRLIGIDKDTIYGTSNKAHTTWEFVDLISDANGYSLATFWKDTSDTSSANFDYLNSDIRKAIDGQGSGTANWFEKSATTWSSTYANKSVLDMLPSDLVSKLKTVSKIVNEKTSESWVETTYSTNLFLLSPLEMGYSNQYAETTVTTYDYYVGKTEETDASRIKQQVKGTDGALTSSTQVTSGAYTGGKYSYAGYNSSTSGEGGIYWLRSPGASVTNRAWYVYCDGYVDFYYVYLGARGVSPCFCL